HRLRVGDAEAVLELGFQAQALAHGRDLGAATVHEHRVHAHVAQQDHVEQCLLLALLHGVAAQLDHDLLAVEALDVRQRLDQNLGAVGGVDRHVVYSALIRTYSADRSQPQASDSPLPRPSSALISISGSWNVLRTAFRSTSTPAPRAKTSRPPMLRRRRSMARSAPL